MLPSESTLTILRHYTIHGVGTDQLEPLYCHLGRFDLPLYRPMSQQRASRTTVLSSEPLLTVLSHHTAHCSTILSTGWQWIPARHTTMPSRPMPTWGCHWQCQSAICSYRISGCDRLGLHNSARDMACGRRHGNSICSPSIWAGSCPAHVTPLQLELSR